MLNIFLSLVANLVLFQIHLLLLYASYACQEFSRQNSIAKQNINKQELIDIPYKQDYCFQLLDHLGMVLSRM